ncbi:MAG: EFR1 family ferrodoxin [Methanoregula sp.]|nr:EFR1 family ferrodoxin [Methanoregula sp.]
MQIDTAKLVYFSPTGTTQKVVRAIARGLNPGSIEEIDITKPAARVRPLQTSEDDLLIIGVPVYVGRVPAIVLPWLKAIRAQNTPAVCVVLYGNRTYEDTLLELRNLVTQCGCRAVAGAAFLGEHSFSDAGTPIAAGRPDAGDLRRAEEFGQKIREQLRSVSPGSPVPEAAIPGQYPYRGDSRLWTEDFIEVSDACTQCGSCAGQCPVGAIDAEDSKKIDAKLCVSCCACIRYCPEHARSIKPGRVKDAQLRLHTLYPDRKEPECFF